MKFIIFLFISLTLCSCSSVTILSGPQKKLREAPDYQQRFNYFFWGLKGEHSVNVRIVCKSKEVKQMEAVYTFSDSFLGLITLGIYSPRTARVWCEKEDFNGV